MASEAKFIATGAKPKGEAFVWLTSMGLSLGLIMVIVLLGVICYNGMIVFWPRRVVELQVTPGKPGGATTIIGEINLKQTKRIDGRRIAEWQLYTANKDTLGASFVFLDESRVKSEQRPQDMIKIERTELGFAIGRPKRLTLEDGRTVDAKDAGFVRTLEEKVEESADRRKEITQIEKIEIGREINSKIDKLQIRIKGLVRQGKGESAEANRHRAEIRSLREEYTQLATKAKKLRDDQEKTKLTILLSDGSELDVTMGNIIHFTFPNQMGFFGRLGQGIRHFWHFVWDEPREANTEGGIFPAIFGTFVMTVLMSILVTPFGVIAAIYMHEYAKQGVVLRLVRIAVNNLAGVPSIVFGVFGLGFFVYLVGGSIDKLFFQDRLPTPTLGTGGILWASLTLALLALPVVIVAAEEALAAVPRGVREASLAMGATKWQTIYRVVLPAATPGIITGMILAMARGAGEVAPLMLVGVVKMAPDLPLNTVWPFVHLDQKFMHLGFHIYDLGFQSPDSEAAKPMVFATTVLLIALVVTMNLAGIVIRERLRSRYATNTF